VISEIIFSTTSTVSRPTRFVDGALLSHLSQLSTKPVITYDNVRKHATNVLSFNRRLSRVNYRK